ncbi:hypothetical protein PMAYCL1PPCAC_11347, partial [Pristionchus mayeri]
PSFPYSSNSPNSLSPLLFLLHSFLRICSIPTGRPIRMGNACGRGKRPAASRDTSARDNEPRVAVNENESDRDEKPAVTPSPKASMKRSSTPPTGAMVTSRTRASTAKRPSTNRSPNASRARDREKEREREKAKEREREKEEEEDDPIQKFITYALNKGVSGLRAEFEELRLKTIPTKEQCSVFHMVANAQKNRYKDVPCSDDSRVILKELSMGTDYIHGNFCGTPKNPKRFICTQGPLPTTIVDFWSMVWQEGSEFIVMLCNFNEMSKVKCAQYFPPTQKETFVAGNAVITCESVAQQKWPGQITIRRFTLDRIDVNQKRTITHLHWESWPDRGVPPIDATIQKLLQMVCRSSKPAVVHCSAGIGRTGTTVGIQIVTELMDSGKSMETGLGPFLIKMRKQRAGSVQNDQQYVFIHRLLLERYMSEEEKENPKFVKFAKDYDSFMV